MLSLIHESKNKISGQGKAKVIASGKRAQHCVQGCIAGKNSPGNDGGVKEERNS
jgi:hypothetical protein